ncbi:hypothetical protein SNL152K_8258 [Streptomyces sp. NL15-2K]|nr:hypothetical protein SNL152K_8258 [Streptomyces sp. NL15-2K]
MGCHGPHLLQGELDASRPYLGGCRLKPLDHKDCQGVSSATPCALPHAVWIPTQRDSEAGCSRPEWSNPCTTDRSCGDRERDCLGESGRGSVGGAAPPVRSGPGGEASRVAEEPRM